MNFVDIGLKPGLENREYGLGDPLNWRHGTLYPQKLALASPTNGGRSVGIVRSRTTAKEFPFVLGGGLKHSLPYTVSPTLDKEFTNRSRSESRRRAVVQLCLIMDSMNYRLKKSGPTFVWHMDC
jgi:hypothetical protein